MSIYEIDAKVKELRELRNMEAEVLLSRPMKVIFRKLSIKLKKPQQLPQLWPTLIKQKKMLSPL